MALLHVGSEAVCGVLPLVWRVALQNSGVRLGRHKTTSTKWMGNQSGTAVLPGPALPSPPSCQDLPSARPHETRVLPPTHISASDLSRATHPGHRAPVLFSGSLPLRGSLLWPSHTRCNGKPQALLPRPQQVF